MRPRLFLQFPFHGWEGRVSLPEVSIISQVWRSQLIMHFRSKVCVFAISYFSILIVVQDFTKTALKFNIIENHYVPREKKFCEKYENLCLGTYHEYRWMESSNFPAAIFFRKQPKLSNSIFHLLAAVTVAVAVALAVAAMAAASSATGAEYFRTTFITFISDE